MALALSCFCWCRGYPNDTFFAALNANFPLHAVTFPADMIGEHGHDDVSAWQDDTMRDGGLLRLSPWP